MNAIKKLILISAACCTASAWASVDITGFSVSEAAGTGTFNVTVGIEGETSQSVPGIDYKLDYQTRDGTAEDESGDNDYKSKSGTLDFSGNVTQQITIDIVQDGKIEGDEHFFVDLFEVPAEGWNENAEAPAVAKGPVATGTGNIIDDDIELQVNVEFQGGGGGPVEIVLDCNGNGTIDDSTKTTSGGVVSFEVINYVEPLDCTAVPAGPPSGQVLVESDCNPGMDEEDTECTIVFAPTRATFTVTKDFTDGNPNEIEVTISCNTGLPIEQSKDIDETESVEFVVVEFDANELDCDVDEAVPNGYSPEYGVDGNQGGVAGSVEADDDGCHFLEVESGEFACQIVNSPDPVDIDITKEWVYEGSSDPQGINTYYELTLYCNGEIVDGSDWCGEDPASQPKTVTWCKTFEGNGPDEFNAEVIPNYPSSSCYVVEHVYDGAVEVDNGCQRLTVSAGQGDSCTIVNTVFFEGIPALNTYGLALLALAMLGVGLVGFRRFA